MFICNTSLQLESTALATEFICTSASFLLRSAACLFFCFWSAHMLNHAILLGPCCQPHVDLLLASPSTSAFMTCNSVPFHNTGLAASRRLALKLRHIAFARCCTELHVMVVTVRTQPPLEFHASNVTYRGCDVDRWGFVLQTSQTWITQVWRTTSMPHPEFVHVTNGLCM